VSRAEVDQHEENPVSKVVELMSQLQDRMIKKGAASQEIYNEFAAWCTKRQQDFSLELKSDQHEKKDLEAQVVDDESKKKTEDMKGDDEAEDIAVSDADLSKATKLREKEATDFAKEEKELLEVVSMLKRAKDVVAKELGGGASMLQLKSAKSLTEALSVMVRAAIVSSTDADKLAGLVQLNDEDTDDDDNTAAPAVASYEKSSGGVLNMLKELLERAESELEQLRAKEEKALADYNLLKQSLKQEITYSEDDKSIANKEESEAKEEQSIDEGDLGMTVKDVEADVKDLGDLRRVCIQKVEEFTSMHKSRDEELKALAEAKKIIVSKTGSASSSTYGEEEPASLIQVRASGRMSTKVQSAAMRMAAKSAVTSDVVHRLKKLALKHKSTELAQLVSRMKATLRSGAEAGEDPFAKVVGMISDMIQQLEEEASADADKKQYCDKELGDASKKKADRADTVDDLLTKIDQMLARSKHLKKQVVKVEAFLAKTATAQSEMDKLRQEEHAEFLSEKSELDQGLDGIRSALKVLNDYYGGGDKGHKADSSAAGNILSLLETVESDFSKSLAELQGSEEISQADYEKETQDNSVLKSAREAEVKAKTKEFTSLDKGVADLKSDLSGVESELNAVSDYLAKLKGECVFDKVESYAEQKEQREAEIAGLKDALTTLEKETAFFQVSSQKRRQRRQQHFLG